MATHEKERGVPNGRYKKLESELRTELIAAQERLQQARFPTLIVLGGCAWRRCERGRAPRSGSGWTRTALRSAPLSRHPQKSASVRSTGATGSLCRKGNNRHLLERWYDRPLRDLAHGAAMRRRLSATLAALRPLSMSSSSMVRC